MGDFGTGDFFFFFFVGVIFFSPCNMLFSGSMNVREFFFSSGRVREFFFGISLFAG